MLTRLAALAAALVCIATSVSAAEPKTEPEDDAIARKLSEKIGPFVQTGRLDMPQDKEYRAWIEPYKRLTVDEKVRYCIYQLRNESWFETTWPYSDKPYTTEPESTASRELIKIGRPAIPRLIEALESRVSTKIYPTRHIREPWLVQDAALDVIQHIACRPFGDLFILPTVCDSDEKTRKQNISELIDWWAKNKGLDETQWAKDALFSKSSGGDRDLAVTSLYLRLGKDSYPFLDKAYLALPRCKDNADNFDDLRSFKVRILQFLLKSPTAGEKAVFSNALHDAPRWVRIDGAEGLWALGDSSGLELLIEETNAKLLNDFGSKSLDTEYCNLISLFVRCSTSSSRETVCKCLTGRNPYLRQEAIRATPRLRMEKAVRALPELFDDPFVLGGSYKSFEGTIERTVPPRRVCDEAAETFTKLVPDAPPFDGTTTETQQRSIEKLTQWWKENGGRLKWDEKRGLLVRP